jgi:hypothetical protein
VRGRVQSGKATDLRAVGVERGVLVVLLDSLCIEVDRTSPVVGLEGGVALVLELSGFFLRAPHVCVVRNARVRQWWRRAMVGSRRREGQTLTTWFPCNCKRVSKTVNGCSSFFLKQARQ